MKITGTGKLWILGTVGAVVGLQLLSASGVAHAHDGINEGQSPWTAWNTNPLPTILLLMVANLYITGLSRWKQPSHPTRRWQKICFFTGLFLLFLVLQTPIDSLSAHLFSFHQTQHIVLRMFGPVLIFLGAPLTPMLRGLPRWALRGVVRPLVSNQRVKQVYDLITNPVFTTALFLGVLFLWQLPGAHNAALRNSALHEFMHITMLLSGFLFWWLVIDPKPHRSRLHYGLRILYLGLIVIPNTVLGAAITFSDGVIYQAYADVEQPINISLITDQQLGAAILWVPGDMMSLIVAGFVMILWYQNEVKDDPVGIPSPRSD